MCLVLKELKIDRVDLVGHSLGSLIGQIIAAYSPEVIRNLVLIGTGTRAPSTPGSWLFEHVMSMQFPLDPRGEFMNEWYANPFPVDAEFEEASRREAANIKAHVWKGVVRSLSFSDLLPPAASDQSPAADHLGGSGSAVRQRRSRRARQCPSSRAIFALEGSGHNPHWDFAGRVAEEIKAFAAPPR